VNPTQGKRRRGWGGREGRTINRRGEEKKKNTDEEGNCGKALASNRIMGGHRVPSKWGEEIRQTISEEQGELRGARAARAEGVCQSVQAKRETRQQKCGLQRRHVQLQLNHTSSSEKPKKKEENCGMVRSWKGEEARTKKSACFARIYWTGRGGHAYASAERENSMVQHVSGSSGGKGGTKDGYPI